MNMASDVPQLCYVFPRFPGGYNTTMKTLTSSLKYAHHDPHQFRLHVLKYGAHYGPKAAVAAFLISRRTYFLWQKRFRDGEGKLAVLVPKSTRPHHTRTMVVDPHLLACIQGIRETYGRIGKEKLKVLVNAYAASLHLPGYGATKIGKIIARYHFYYDRGKKHQINAFNRERMKRSPRAPAPGYLEMDSIHLHLNDTSLVFVTVIDVATRIAYAERISSANSLHAQAVLKHFQSLYPLPLHTIQTDNGSEFLGDFHHYLEKVPLRHVFSYPRSPKINGYIERFNRTLQEEFVDRCDAWWYDKEQGDTHLTKYLQWYNAVRPHAALGNQPPIARLNQLI
jgi:transposase InsO family protein